MEEKVISSIGGVGVYGLISICIFFAFFTGMLIWAVCLKKSHIEKMCGLPLDEGSERPENPEPSETK